jgi:RIO-like serine/threonine protein kinase
MDPPNGKETYSWNDPDDKWMLDFGIDFRPPSVDQSWRWVMDNSQFEDGQWMPSGENLAYKRHALLLEYLPRARRIDYSIITKEIALQAFSGAQAIQKALVYHGDQCQRNLLVTRDSRAVWVDFDKAEVYDYLPEKLLLRFKLDLRRIHMMLFTYMVGTGSDETCLDANSAVASRSAESGQTKSESNPSDDNSV